MYFLESTGLFNINCKCLQSMFQDCPNEKPLVFSYSNYFTGSSLVFWVRI